MELIQTTETIAKSVLESGKRKIQVAKNSKMYEVVSINENNHTSQIKTGKNSELTVNNEDLVFYISVPKNSKNVF